MEVWSGHDEIGVVEQNWTMFAPSFTIKNDVGNAIYHIDGPNMCACAMYKEADFKVITAQPFLVKIIARRLGHRIERDNSFRTD